MPSVKKEIQKSAIFSELTSNELKFLQGYLEEKTYHPNDLILSQGSQGSDLYIIQSGTVLVKVTLPGHTTKIATSLGAGQIFGEVAFLSDGLITANILAESRVVCLTISRKMLTVLRTAFPETAFKIERAIAYEVIQKIKSNLEKIHHLLQLAPVQTHTATDYAHILPKLNAKETSIDVNTLDITRLKEMALFRSLSEKETEIFLSFLQAKKFERGYRFSAEDSKHRVLNLINFGAVMLFVVKKQQLIKSIGVSGPGDLFLQNFLCADFTHLTCYVACEECIILQLSYDNYLQLQKQHSEIFYKISPCIHSTIVGSLYIINRQFVRMNSEYSDILS